ncbi:MAG: AarF/ABC1/UbiB kinase family protein [Victivallales bacterium]
MLFHKRKSGWRHHQYKRYQTVVGVLIKHGFYDFVENSNLLRFVPFRHRYMPEGGLRDEEEKLNHWKRIRLVLEELGPAYVKLGQFVSNRPDLLPQELCIELESLLDSVPPFDNSEAVKIIEKEFNVPINMVFKHFTETPFSSASIAQVHKATLHDGTKVAVKIQRPGIREVINADLEIMGEIAGLLEKYVSGMNVINPVGIVEEFKVCISEELDFINEADNIEKFTRKFGRDKRVCFPKVYKEYTTTRVLVMEMVEGESLVKIKEGGNPNYNLDLIATTLSDLLMDQIFEHGYFHGDPHQGNIIIRENNVICFVDFGQVGILSPRNRQVLREIIIGLVQRDPRRVANATMKLSTNSEIINREEFENRVFKIIDKYAGVTLHNLNLSKFFNDLFKLVISSKLMIPSDLYLLGKAITSLEGTLRKIKPDFNIIEHIEPFVRKMILENISPYNIFKDVYTSLSDYSELFRNLPGGFRDILNQFKNRNIKIQFEHKGLEPMLHKHDQISNRISFSIVSSSLIIGSSLIIHAKIPPMVFGISFLGLFTFIFALMMSVFLLISILRHGRM